MSKLWNNKEIVGKYIGKRVIIEVYRGLKIIWQAINSCFGAGYWRGDKPWNGNDAWKG